uniref:Uncharacterized protein n=1 Tax=Trichogramma kaykai TaxID=54128 RepID=A0ABD2WEZ6_9HYME
MLFFLHADVRLPRVNRFLIQKVTGKTYLAATRNSLLLAGSILRENRTYGLSVAARTAIMQKVANEYIEVAAAGHTSRPHHPQ